MRFQPLPPGTKLFVVSTIIVMLAWVVWGSLKYPETLWAPGDLSRFHFDITACSDCHQPFHGVTPDKCIACHDGKDFADRSKSKVTEFHQQSILERKTCTECHTEHRGVLAQITIRALYNPHGEFIFLATGTKSCSACHNLSSGFQSHLKLLENGIVRHLMEEGDGAHKPGKMFHCLSCHERGRLKAKEDEVD